MMSPAGRFSLRTTVVFASLVALVLFSGITYALVNLDPTLQDLLHMPAASGDYTTIHQSKTIGGVTITVEQISAQSDKIVVAWQYDQAAKSAGQENEYDEAYLYSISVGETKPITGFASGAGGSQTALNDGIRRTADVTISAKPDVQGDPKNVELHLQFRVGKHLDVEVGKDPTERMVTFDITVPFQRV